MNAQKILEQLRGLDVDPRMTFWEKCDDAIAAGIVPRIEISNIVRLVSHSSAYRITFRDDLHIEFMQVAGVLFLERTCVLWLHPSTSRPHRIEDQHAAISLFAAIIGMPSIPMMTGVATV